MNNYRPTNEQLFFSKNDSQDIRLGDVFKRALISDTHLANSYAILGYPDDEGIKLNGGRIGASLAPPAIRQFLYKMTPPAELQKKYYDLGDLNPSEISLPERHTLAQKNIFDLQSQNINTISLGGGHDYGYSDASGFLKAHLPKGIKPVVINFDAHLDVRSPDKGFNSGTPFNRLLCEFESQFEFIEVGIQPQCNSPQHLLWAQSKGAHIFGLKEIESQNGLMSLLEKPIFKKLSPQTPVYLSFDIDGLTSTEARGCSQSWVTGLKTQDVLNFFLALGKKVSFKGLGIYEVSPPLDFDNHTSKTAALLIYHYLFNEVL